MTMDSRFRIAVQVLRDIVPVALVAAEMKSSWRLDVQFDQIVEAV